MVLEDNDGKGDLVSGSFLGTLLHDEDTIRLAILNSCNGARSSITDPFSGVAQSLLQQGVPAVIAMQFEITDEAAISFADEFYSSLIAGYPVDAAMVESRKKIYASKNEIEWATPVLYLSTNNTHIFNHKQLGKKEYGSTEDDNKSYYKPAVLIALLFLVGVIFFLAIWVYPPLTSSDKNVLSKISLNNNHACYLEKNGYLYCWSSDLRGVVGSLTDNALDVSVGYYGEVCAILNDEKVRCWSGHKEKWKDIILPNGFTPVGFTRALGLNSCIIGSYNKVLCVTDIGKGKTVFLKNNYRMLNLDGRQVKVIDSEYYCLLERDSHKVSCRLRVMDTHKKVVLSDQESPIAQFDFNRNYICAVKQDGKLICHNYLKDKTVKMDTYFGSNIKQVITSLFSICVLKNNGTAICKNNEMLPALESIYPKDDHKPLPEGLLVEKMFNDEVDMCAITTDDKIYCRREELFSKLLKKYKWVTEKI